MIKLVISECLICAEIARELILSKQLRIYREPTRPVDQLRHEEIASRDIAVSEARPPDRPGASDSTRKPHFLIEGGKLRILVKDIRPSLIANIHCQNGVVKFIVDRIGRSDL